MLVGGEEGLSKKTDEISKEGGEGGKGERKVKIAQFPGFLEDKHKAFAAPRYCLPPKVRKII